MSEHIGKAEKLKCYWTYDRSMEHQSFVFAKKRSEAIYNSEAYQWDSDWTDIRAERMPEFDQYVDSDIPKQALLEKGWWFECYGWRCDRHLTIDDNPLIVDNHVYCNQECRDRKRDAI